MSAVVAIEGRNKGCVMILADGSQVWTPDAALAATLVGQEIPADWTQKLGDYGPQAFPPKKPGEGGGKAAWGNTEAGARFQQDRIDARTDYIQERTDRRTAAMQATTDGEFSTGIADLIYGWLRRTRFELSEPAAGGTGSHAPAPASVAADVPSAAAPSGDTENPAPETSLAGAESVGKAPAPASDHVHDFSDVFTDLKGGKHPVVDGHEVCTICGIGRRKAKVAS